MQPRELRRLGTDELHSRLEDAYQEQFNLRRALSLGRLEDHNRIEAVKRDIARIKTILRERELAAELSQAGEEVQ